jgi:hypothetical protein
VADLEGVVVSVEADLGGYDVDDRARSRAAGAALASVGDGDDLTVTGGVTADLGSSVEIGGAGVLLEGSRSPTPPTGMRNSGWPPRASSM